MFAKQKRLFELARLILDVQFPRSLWAFGGGTALSAMYWQHRLSTDIDIFLYGGQDILSLIPNPKNRQLQSKIFKELYDLGFVDFYHNGYYLEYSFGENAKIQFMPSNALTAKPWSPMNVFGYADICVERIEEIIAKKIFYRYKELKPRDIIDIGVALKKNKNLLATLERNPHFSLDLLADFAGRIEAANQNGRLLEVVRQEADVLQMQGRYKEMAYEAPRTIVSKIDSLLDRASLALWERQERKGFSGS